MKTKKVIKNKPSRRKGSVPFVVVLMAIICFGCAASLYNLKITSGLRDDIFVLKGNLSKCQADFSFFERRIAASGLREFKSLDELETFLKQYGWCPAVCDAKSIQKIALDNGGYILNIENVIIREDNHSSVVALNTAFIGNRKFYIQPLAQIPTIMDSCEIEKTKEGEETCFFG